MTSDWEQAIDTLLFFIDGLDITAHDKKHLHRLTERFGRALIQQVAADAKDIVASTFTNRPRQRG